MTSDLSVLGIDSFAEAVYRHALQQQTVTPASIAEEFGCTQRRAAATLQGLRDAGLLGRLSGSRRRFAAIEPATAIDALVRTRATQLDQARLAVAELGELHARPAADEHEAEIEIIVGSNALGREFVRLQQEAREDFRSLDRPPYALTTDNPVEGMAIARGVRYRAVYAREALTWPGVLDDIDGLVALGEEARVLPTLPIKLAIADRRRALLPLSLDMSNLRAAVVRPSTLLDALVEYWQLCWDQAVPLAAPTAPDELGADDRRMLSLLVSGLKDDAVARQLGWSLRTMRRRISRMNVLLGADNRFQAGVIASRRGWI